MEKVIKKVLGAIEKSGYEAYIIGGYVRDLMLGKMSWDVDICTNALPKDLIQIFPNANVGIYGAIDFKIGKYSFEITTYRKEFNYSNRHPGKIEYINNLLEDIERRDFKINTICMNQRGNIIDILGAEEDINNKLITAVGNSNRKLKEDPLRILRAVRFATLLDFSLNKDLKEAIIDNKNLVLELSDTRILDELNKILISDNYLKGLELLKQLGILDILEIDYGEIVKTSDVCGMWAQLTLKKNLAFNKETIHNINTIKKIVSTGIIDVNILYNYGLYLSMVAGSILKMNNKKIASIYSKMPIKCRKDLNITSIEVMELLNIKEGEQVGIIISELEQLVLNKKLSNNEKEIKRYLLSHYRGD